MLILLAVLLAIGAAAGVIAVVRLTQILAAIEQNTAETRELRIASRARVRRASMQSGATSDEQVLSRLGRASVARRVVVGGDNDSQLYSDMSITTDGGTDG